MLHFIEPVANQGQIIQVGYFRWRNMVYKRILDCSTNSAEFYASTALKSDEGDYLHFPPLNKRWRRITGDEIRRIFMVELETMK